MSTDAGHREQSEAASAPLRVLLVATATSAVIALPYWMADSRAVADDGILGFFWLVAAALVVGTVAACCLAPTHQWLAMAAMLACVPVAVLGRVLIDTASDPTSHNLWPFEVVLGVMASVPPVLLGALVAWPVRRLVLRPRLS